jgi:hypothetical protein
MDNGVRGQGDKGRLIELVCVLARLALVRASRVSRSGVHRARLA